MAGLRTEMRAQSRESSSAHLPAATRHRLCRMAGPLTLIRELLGRWYHYRHLRMEDADDLCRVGWTEAHHNVRIEDENGMRPGKG